ncbi:MAG: ATPase [Clostridia bacterium]|nr:ATPase [Clostridia bacterium]
MKKILGIEFGSTRIKAVLTDENAAVIAQGGFEWENVLVDGLWSYDMDDVVKGLRESYAGLAGDYRAKYGEDLTDVSCIGVSGMMHGYLAFDENDRLLAPFRTWRNTNAEAAASELTRLFGFHIPMRWSVSQFWQSVLDGLPHVNNVAHLNTLAGYVHYLLTGKRVLGFCEASGMFPLDEGGYDSKMLGKFDRLLRSKGIERDFVSLLPEVLPAGSVAGTLTEAGALLIDPSGKLKPGAPLCPPEGDMGTGMTATNSIAPHTANISSGTSANICVVLEKPLKNYYEEVDILNTPDGYPVALIHTNNCTSEINEWVDMFGEVASLCGAGVDRGELFKKLFEKSLESDGDAGGIVCYNYLAGEPMANTVKGALMTLRRPDGKMTLANFMQAQIYAALAALALGVGILDRENVKIDSVTGHGGFYKTEFVGQNATAAVLGAPVTVMKNAGEGGAWGIALLALFTETGGGSLPEFLNAVFKDTEKTVVSASEAEKAKFKSFIRLYKAGLAAEKLASESI